MEAVTLKKYPWTPHLEGSRLQLGGRPVSGAFLLHQGNVEWITTG